MLGLSKEHSSAITNSLPQFVKHLDPSVELLSILRAENHLTDYQYDQIMEERTRDTKASKLMSTLLYSTKDSTFTALVAALVETRQDDLATLLDQPTAQQLIEKRQRELIEPAEIVEVSPRSVDSSHRPPDPQPASAVNEHSSMASSRPTQPDSTASQHDPSTPSSGRYITDSHKEPNSQEPLRSSTQPVVNAEVRDFSKESNPASQYSPHPTPTVVNAEVRDLAKESNPASQSPYPTPTGPLGRTRVLIMVLPLAALLLAVVLPVISESLKSSRNAGPIKSPKSFKKAFEGRKAELVQAIDVAHGLWTKLDDKEVLTDQQIEDCKIQKTNSERAEKMMELLEKRESSLLTAFCVALIEDGQRSVVVAHFNSDDMCAETLQ